MTKQIDQILFLEKTDFEFQVQFTYCDKIITTKQLPRTVTEAEILDIIREAVIIFDNNYNEEAFNNMKAKYSGKSLVIS
jgi:hypothetical protein